MGELYIYNIYISCTPILLKVARSKIHCAILISQLCNETEPLFSFFFIFNYWSEQIKLLLVGSSIWARTKPHLPRWCEVVLPEVTSVTWPEVMSPETPSPEAILTGSDRAQQFPAVFSYYSSTKCVIAHDRQVPEVPQRRFPCVCACASGSCAISALVGPFDRKWRHHP